MIKSVFKDCESFVNVFAVEPTVPFHFAGAGIDGFVIVDDLCARLRLRIFKALATFVKAERVVVKVHRG